MTDLPTIDRAEVSQRAHELGYERAAPVANQIGDFTAFKETDEWTDDYLPLLRETAGAKYPDGTTDEYGTESHGHRQIELILRDGGTIRTQSTTITQELVQQFTLAMMTAISESFQDSLNA